VRAAALVADPTGDTDREPKPEIGGKLFGWPREAMCDAPPGRGVLAQDGDEIRMRVALVEENRFAELACELELAVEGGLLRSARRVIPEVIESALADRHDLRLLSERAQFGRALGGEFARVVRVDAGRREEPAAVLARQTDRALRRGKRRARDDHLRDARDAGAFDHRLAIGIVTVVREIDADVDELCRSDGGGRSRGCAMVWHESAHSNEQGSEQRMPVTSAAGCRRARWRARWVAALPLMLPIASGVASGGPPEWRDIESRIQYGYYTEDTAALRKLVEPLAVDDSHDKLRGYYAALLDWRLALLAPLSGSSEIAHRCVTEIDAVLASEADFAEGLALRSACLAQPLTGGGLHLPLAAHGVHRDITRALELAARNPRVLLIDGMNGYQLPSSLGGNKDKALATLRQAATAFEAERAVTEHVPGWGAAEAYFYLGRGLLDRGDTLGARDALEHALLIAPEFVAARRLMAKITSGR